MDLIWRLMNYLDQEKNGQFAEIPDNFFPLLNEKIAELERKYKRGEADEIEADQFITLLSMRKDLFERRFRKLVKLAMLKVLGYDSAYLPYHITSKESEFFKNLISLMLDFKKDLLDYNGKSVMDGDSDDE